ncbi:MAG: glycine cleavage system regulatory protein [Acidimicrobiales bacterium]|jgi:glycine cleavage system regulatory protein
MSPSVLRAVIGQPMSDGTTIPAMASVVITFIGDDRAGLVDTVAGVVASHGGNWDRSHLAELAGKFAGIVLVQLPDASVDALLGELGAIASQGLLAITAERATTTETAGTTSQVSLELIGQDHPGIVHEISHVLVAQNISIDELETRVAPAPQGGNLFIAHAVLELPDGSDLDALRSALEAVAHDLMVDLDLILE